VTVTRHREATREDEGRMNYLLITLAASLAVPTCAFTCGAVAGLRHVRYGSIKTGSSLTMALQPLDIMPKHLKLCVGIDTNGVPEARTTEELFGGKRCIIFGVPGAFLGELSEQYLTSFMTKHDDLKGAGEHTLTTPIFIYVCVYPCVFLCIHVYMYIYMYI